MKVKNKNTYDIFVIAEKYLCGYIPPKLYFDYQKLDYEEQKIQLKNAGKIYKYAINRIALLDKKMMYEVKHANKKYVSTYSMSTIVFEKEFLECQIAYIHQILKVAGNVLEKDKWNIFLKYYIDGMNCMEISKSISISYGKIRRIIEKSTKIVLGEINEKNF